MTTTVHYYLKNLAKLKRHERGLLVNIDTIANGKKKNPLLPFIQPVPLVMMLTPLASCPAHCSSIHTSKAALSEPTPNIIHTLKYLVLNFITSKLVINGA